MIQINKEKDKIVLSLVTQLDREDVYELVSDLNKWLDATTPLPKFKGISEDKVRESKAYSEAKAQNESKNKLAEDMRRVFVDLLDSEYIEKMAKVYELDPKTKEVIVKDKKLKDEKRNKRN